MSSRRRLFVWMGVAFALGGSVLILWLSRQRTAHDLRLLIRQAADSHALDPELVEAVVEAESGGNPQAVSRAQAYGLMQLRIPTASEVADRDITVNELFDPAINLDLGCRYLRRMLERYGDVRLALMAYNAGPSRVDRWRKLDPDPAGILENHAFGQTRAYVRKVLAHTRKLKQS